MEKHPCLQCKRMPRGRNMEVEPCASCREPEKYCDRIGPAGVGSVPYRITDYQPRKKTAMGTAPSPHARTKDGPHATCRDRASEPIDGERKNRERRSPSKGKAKPAPDVPGKRSPEHDGIKRELDFDGHGDLMRAIEEDATAQFREFNAHVLFILKRHVDQRKTGSLQ